MAEILALDVDALALQVAKLNFEASPWEIQLVEADFRTWSPGSEVTTFMCNPPYDDAVVNLRVGSSAEVLSRRRALERQWLPLEELCGRAKSLSPRACLWILWGGVEDAPVLRAAKATGWTVARCVRLQREAGGRPFATAWKLGDALEMETETRLWQDADAQPSKQWWDLVGSLYYWHMRQKGATIFMNLGGFLRRKPVIVLESAGRTP